MYSTNIGAEYFKHGIYCPLFSLQNAVRFIILTYLVPVLFTFYIQVCQNLKNNSGAKRLNVKLDEPQILFGRLRKLLCLPNRSQVTTQMQLSSSILSVI